MDTDDTPSQPALILLGCCATVAGVVQVFFAQFEGLLLPSLLLSTAIGAAALFWSLCRPGSYSPQAVLAAGFCLAYGFGALNAVDFTLGLDALNGVELFPGSEASPMAIARGHGYVLLASGLLLLWGGFTRPFSAPMPPRNAETPTLVLTLVAFVVLFAGAMLATGRLGFQGNVTGEEGSTSASVLGVLAGQTLVPAAALAVYAAVQAPARLRVWLIAAAALVMVLVVTQGRRVFMYGLLVMVLAYVCGGGRVSLKKPQSWLIVALAAGTLYVAFRFFLALRMANWEIGGYAHIDELVVHAWEIFTGARGGDLDNALSENVKSRTFILDYLSLMVERISIYGGLDGQLLARAIGISLPSVLYRDKVKVLELGSEETLTHAHVGLVEWDGPNSLLTAGVGDFGVIGLLAYPLVVCGLLWLILWVARRYLPPLVSMFILFTTTNLLLSVEAELPGYITNMRNLAVLVVLFLVMLMARQALRSFSELGAPRSERTRP